jgi:MOSC domain-containing protein
MSNAAGRGASVVGLWRYPVKSMMGEELNSAELTGRGLVGDRHFALRDRETGKFVGAKNPRKWPTFFDFRASFVEPPRSDRQMPAARITFPDGAVATTDQADLARLLSSALGREVTVEEAPDAGRPDAVAPDPWSATAEEYWPDMEGLDHRDTVTDFDLPEGTFFDSAVVHILTTATLESLRSLYPGGRFESRRFRPNIVVATGPDELGFVENGWVDHSLAIGDRVRLRVTGPCPRCVMTTLAQGDLPKDPGILRAAAQHNAANVGVYASVEQGGAIKRGDLVRAL